MTKAEILALWQTAEDDAHDLYHDTTAIHEGGIVLFAERLWALALKACAHALCFHCKNGNEAMALGQTWVHLYQGSGGGTSRAECKAAAFQSLLLQGHEP